MAAESVADSLAPLIGLVNLAGFGAAVWWLSRARGTRFAAAAWIAVVGTGIHVVNDALGLIGMEPDDAYDHLWIHLVFLAVLVALSRAMSASGIPPPPKAA
jgi:hypothetical protein